MLFGELSDFIKVKPLDTTVELETLVRVHFSFNYLITELLLYQLKCCFTLEFNVCFKIAKLDKIYELYITDPSADWKNIKYKECYLI